MICFRTLQIDVLKFLGDALSSMQNLRHHNNIGRNSILAGALSELNLRKLLCPFRGCGFGTDNLRIRYAVRQTSKSLPCSSVPLIGYMLLLELLANEEVLLDLGALIIFLLIVLERILLFLNLRLPSFATLPPLLSRYCILSRLQLLESAAIN